MTLPLAGLRVLDFSVVPPGAICTVMLADLGAEVIRVESPKAKGKPSLLFGQLQMSRAKRSITLDMRSPSAPEVLSRLVRHADIAIDASRPGAMEERGWGYPQARAANPAIVWCAMTGFGQEGPYAGHSGHDVNFLAHSGLLSQMSADPAFEPGIQMAIPYGALCAVIGIQGALLERSRTGEGAFVDISYSAAATWVLNGAMDPFADPPGILRPSPERHRYRCADGREIVLACAEPRTWQALCDTLGLDDLRDRLFRWDDADAVQARIAEQLLARPALEWVDVLAAAGAAISIVNHARDLQADPQARLRGNVAVCQGQPVPGNPVRIVTAQGATGTRTEGAPIAGQDNADVFAHAGFTPQELADLEAAGIV